MMRVLGTLAVEAPESVREKHNEILALGLVPLSRAQSLGALDWSVHSAPEGGVIFPDCVALAEDDETGLKPLIMGDVTKLTTALMPLSSSTVLVGLRNGCPQPDLNAFNKAAASCSHEFFIAARTGSDLESLVQLVGSSSDQVIRNSIDEAFEPLLQRATPSARSQNRGDTTVSTEVGLKEVPTMTDANSPDKPKYSIHFLGCADGEAASRISVAVGAATRPRGQTH